MFEKLKKELRDEEKSQRAKKDNYIEVAISGVKNKGRVMESGRICIAGEDWDYKIKKVRK